MKPQATFSWSVRVYYEDTDTVGVVYYANYLKFMERARTEWLRAQGIYLDELAEKDKRCFVVQQVNIDYKYPARFNDLLSVDSSVLFLGKASLKMQQVISNQAGQVCCKAEVKLACVDTCTLRPRRFPPTLFQDF